MTAAVRMLRKDCGAEATVRVCGLTGREIGWLAEHGDFERGVMKVAPPVLDAQPARWLAAMRIIGGAKADTEREILRGGNKTNHR